VPSRKLFGTCRFFWNFVQLFGRFQDSFFSAKWNGLGGGRLRVIFGVQALSGFSVEPPAHGALRLSLEGLDPGFEFKDLGFLKEEDCLPLIASGKENNQIVSGNHGKRFKILGSDVEKIRWIHWCWHFLFLPEKST
jgi:hypothetical protein